MSNATSVSAEAGSASLPDILVRTGQCDSRAVERGRRVAEETGQRFDKVLLQLGLVSERGLADAYAAMLNLPVVHADRYPVETPLFVEALPARFLRNVRAIPLAIDGDALALAVV